MEKVSNNKGKSTGNHMTQNETEKIIKDSSKSGDRVQQTKDELKNLGIQNPGDINVKLY